jgi:glucose/arabinose dehydrogenase
MGHLSGDLCRKLLAMKSMLAAFVAVIGVSQAAFSRPLGGNEVEITAAEKGYAVETVCEGLEVPWSIAFLPGGKSDMLITERPGRVRLYADGKLNPVAVYEVPGIKTMRGGEIGLMGMCVHPEFEKNKWVYLAFGHTDGDIRVTRYVYGPAKRQLQEGQTDPGGLTDEKIIVKGIKAGANHAGCCIKFGPDGKLYISTGEMFQGKLAQDMTGINGKILRVNDDGSAPSDNPFVGEEFKAKGVRPEIWSYGHRNPQGFDWQPGTGVIFGTEHGPSGEGGTGQGGDELNLIEKGKNYGWPTIHHMQTNEGMETPLKEWTPPIAPSGGSFYSGDKFPEWKGNYFFGALGGLRVPPQPGVVRVTLDGRKFVSAEFLATEYGRIRDVIQGPDGYIYFTTSNKDGRGKAAPNDDRVMRLVPAK